MVQVATRLTMMILPLSAAFVGFVHSLAPGHWLPVVLMAKTRRWPLRNALIGAAVTASGHIFLSLALGIASIWIGVHFLSQYEAQIERFAGLGLSVFGVLYAAYAWFSHSHCIGHTHHGPDPKGKRSPYLFLFSLGFSPCVAVLPIFAAAAATDKVAMIAMTLACFAVGVFAALLGSTYVIIRGLVKLDHPLFEHYGDVITGCGVAIMGLFLFGFSQ